MNLLFDRLFNLLNFEDFAICNNEGNKNEHPPIGWETKRCYFTGNDEKRVVEPIAVVRRKKGITGTFLSGIILKIPLSL